MIRDHVWRAPTGDFDRTRVPLLDWPCEFMNCGRPRREHERAASGRLGPAKAGAR